MPFPGVLNASNGFQLLSQGKSVSYQGANSGGVPGPGNEISDLPEVFLSVHISFAYAFCNLLVLS